jgi:hypothetical protein
MSTLLPAVESLAGLAGQINAAHLRAESAIRDGLAHAREAGKLLIKAKKLAGHGNWLPWLKRHCRFSQRTAQVYMRVARLWPQLSANPQRVAHLTLREAIEPLITEEPGDWLAVARAEGHPFARWLQIIDEALAWASEAFERPDATLEEVLAVQKVAQECAFQAGEMKLWAERHLGELIAARKAARKKNTHVKLTEVNGERAEG